MDYERQDSHKVQLQELYLQQTTQANKKGTKQWTKWTTQWMNNKKLLKTIIGDFMQTIVNMIKSGTNRR